MQGGGGRSDVWFQKLKLNYNSSNVNAGQCGFNVCIHGCKTCWVTIGDKGHLRLFMNTVMYIKAWWDWCCDSPQWVHVQQHELRNICRSIQTPPTAALLSQLNPFPMCREHSGGTNAAKHYNPARHHPSVEITRSVVWSESVEEMCWCVFVLSILKDVIHFVKHINMMDTLKKNTSVKVYLWWEISRQHRIILRLVEIYCTCMWVCEWIYFSSWLEFS